MCVASLLTGIKSTWPDHANAVEAHETPAEMSYLAVATTPEGPRVVLVYARTCPYQKQIEQAGLQNIQQNLQMFMQRMQQFHNARTAAWNQRVSGFEAHQNASQAQSSSWCDTITGLTQAHDPYTGESLKVWTGPNANYYINGLGNKVNANVSPGSAYHQLHTSQ